MATDRKQQEHTTREQELPETGETSEHSAKDTPTEIGGPKGPEPTRYGDWERRGRCIDF